MKDLEALERPQNLEELVELEGQEKLEPLELEMLEKPKQLEELDELDELDELELYGGSDRGSGWIQGHRYPRTNSPSNLKVIRQSEENLGAKREKTNTWRTRAREKTCRRYSPAQRMLLGFKCLQL